MEQKTHSVRPGVILGVLSLSGGAYAMLQSLVVPALPVLEKDLHTTTSGVTWIFTSYLLAASVVTPIAGRLGDMFGKKRVLVLALWGLAAGSLLAALVHTLPLMIVARTIQGLGGAIFPLAFGILRDEFPRERVASAIALMSGILGIGGGLGIVLAGPILQNLSYHWLFWIPLVVTSVSALAATVVIPESTLRAPGNVHWLGAILLSGWLVGLLLAVSESSTWGWGSPKTIGLIAVALVIAVFWVRAESRSTHPLVDMTMMRLSGVWTTNLAALLLGFGMYSAFVLIPQFVQTPKSTGYGFGASVSQAGLFLVPTTLALLVVSPLGGRLSNVVGSKVPLVLGSVVTTIAFIVLALADAKWEIYVASTLVGIGIGFAFASMANLIVEAVPPGQTGVATGMNTIVRTIGGAIGAEVAAAVLAANVLGSGEPDKHGYTITFSICAAVVAAGILASLAVPGRRRVAAAVAAALPTTEPPALQRIVVGIDGSPQAAVALRFAIDEATRLKLPLRIVCAWETPARESAGAAFVPTPDLAQSAERDGDAALAAALVTVGPNPGIPVETASIHGHAAKVLLAEASESTLLVVGTRGHGGLASLVLGSVSQSLSHHCTTPLTIIPS